MNVLAIRYSGNSENFRIFLNAMISGELKNPGMTLLEFVFANRDIPN